jgi:hypothetical protein
LLTLSLSPDVYKWVLLSLPPNFLAEFVLCTHRTEYRAEIFYPSYYDAGRPVPSGIPSNITYGGDSFDLSLPASSLNGTDLSEIKVVLMRTGFCAYP